MNQVISLFAAFVVLYFGVTSFYGMYQTAIVIKQYTITDRLASEWLGWTIHQYMWLILSGIVFKIFERIK